MHAETPPEIPPKVPIDEPNAASEESLAEAIAQQANGAEANGAGYERRACRRTGPPTASVVPPTPPPDPNDCIPLQQLRTAEEIRAYVDQQVAVRTRELQEANGRLMRLTLTDDVTGLFNQRFLFARLEDELHRHRRYNTRLAVMMLDIDHFKEANDRNDHLFGTHVLQRVGRLLRSHVRDADMVIRYGGDEFTVLMPHTSLVAASLVGMRLHYRIQRTNVGDAATPYFVTVSVGVAALGECTAHTARELLQAADKAMYAAKAAGRNCVYSMRENTPSRVSTHSTP